MTIDDPQITLSQLIARDLEPVTWQRAEPFVDDLDVERIYQQAVESSEGYALVAPHVQTLDVRAADALVGRVWPHTTAEQRRALLADAEFRRRLVCEAVRRRAATDGRVSRPWQWSMRALNVGPPLLRWHVDPSLEWELVAAESYQGLRQRGESLFPLQTTHPFTGLSPTRAAAAGIEALARADGFQLKMLVAWDHSPERLDDGEIQMRRMLGELGGRFRLTADLADAAAPGAPFDFAGAEAAVWYLRLRRGETPFFFTRDGHPIRGQQAALDALAVLAAADGFTVGTRWDSECVDCWPVLVPQPRP